MELTLRIHYFSCCYRVTCVANNNNKYLALQMKHFWCAAATKSKVRNAAGTGVPCLGFPRNAAQAQASSGAAVETAWRKPKEVQKFHSNLHPNEKRSQFIDGQKQYPWSLFVSRTQPYRNTAQSTPGSPAASLLAALQRPSSDISRARSCFALCCVAFLFVCLFWTWFLDSL